MGPSWKVAASKLVQMRPWFGNQLSLEVALPVVLDWTSTLLPD